MQNTFNFWHKWLLAVSILFTATGLVIALLPASTLFQPHMVATADLFFEGTIPQEAENLRRFLFGPVGGTVAGYFLLQTCIVWGPFQRWETWAWHAIAGALLVWFITDSSVSMYHGAYFNVWMINIWTLFLVGLPLVMTRHYFSHSKSREN